MKNLNSPQLTAQQVGSLQDLDYLITRFDEELTDNDSLALALVYNSSFILHEVDLFNDLELSEEMRSTLYSFLV